MSAEERLLRELRGFLRGRTLVVGVGNALRGDDGAGPAVVAGLAAQWPEACLDAGAAPENYLDSILQRKPERVLFVDAVDFGGRPGEARLCDWEEMRRYAWDTHRLPLRVLAEYLKAEGGVETRVLGIQAGKVEFGAPVSAEVAEGVRIVTEAITRALSGGSACCTEAKAAWTER